MTGRGANRTQRVADAIQRELAQYLLLEVRDPRIGMVNITSVEVSRDLAHAKVYLTFLEQRVEQDIEDAMEALNKASSFLRTLLAKNLTLRTTPKLKFIYDQSADRGQNLSMLISRAVASDKDKAQQQTSDSKEHIEVNHSDEDVESNSKQDRNSDQ